MSCAPNRPRIGGPLSQLVRSLLDAFLLYLPLAMMFMRSPL